MFDFDWLADPLYLEWLLDGTILTFVISVVGMIAAFAIGVAGAAAVQLRVPLMQTFVRLLVDLFRNTPPLVQLFFLYFMLSDIGLRLNDAHGHTVPLLDGFSCVILSLGFYNGALTVEIIRSGITAVPVQTVEGARSLGYTSAQIFWRIELPIALRLTVPAMTNNVVSLIKTSAQASLIAVADVMYYATQIMQETFDNLEVMLVIWLIYVVISTFFTVLASVLERQISMPGYGLKAS